MKVKDLIAKLEKLDPEEIVYVQDGSYLSVWMPVMDVFTGKLNGDPHVKIWIESE